MLLEVPRLFPPLNVEGRRAVLKGGGGVQVPKRLPEGAVLLPGFDTKFFFKKYGDLLCPFSGFVKGIKVERILKNQSIY